MTRTALSSLAAAAAVTLLSLADPADAFQCKAGFTQADAFRKFKGQASEIARAEWSEAVVGAHGLSWADWKLASSRSVTCNAQGNGYKCVAKGKPCRSDLVQGAAPIAAKRLGTLFGRPAKSRADGRLD